MIILDTEIIVLNKLNEYKILKNAVEMYIGFTSDDSSIQESYSDYISKYKVYADDYAKMSEGYRRLYNMYSVGNSSTPVTEDDVAKVDSAYNSSTSETEALKNAYISQIQTRITAIDNEIKTLESN